MKILSKINNLSKDFFKQTTNTAYTKKKMVLIRSLYFLIFVVIISIVLNVVLNQFEEETRKNTISTLQTAINSSKV